MKSEINGNKKSLFDYARHILRQHDGKLTSQLKRISGGFGLGQVPNSLKPDATTNMTCGFCSTGCTLTIHMKDNQAINITPATTGHVNLGMACPKGWESLEPLKAKDRATTPYRRNSSGKLVPTSWDSALTRFCKEIKTVQEKYGEDSVAFISTGQMVTEEMALLGSLAKFGMGIKHGDGNTRQCMATAAVAYKQAFGFDAPPFTYQDFEESDVLVFVGANPCIAHPIMWERVERNKNNPDIICIDPRKTETAMCSTDHFAINPKSDLPFFYCLANLIVEKGYIQRELLDKHTTGYDDFAEFIKKFTPESVQENSGIAAERMHQLAELIGSGKKVSFWWTMGVNQHHEGTRVAQAIINIALMTGNIGKPGTGANSITGQCNAMGSRLNSNTTSLIGGHDFTNADHRKKIAEILDIDVQCIPDKNSLAYDQIVEKISQGKIKALWVIATNGVHSWINKNDFKKTLKNLDFLVVQDMYYTTETAQVADMVLPAAGWGEKDGTVINSERRIGVLKKVSQAPGDALSDFSIFKLIAEYWGCADMFKRWDTPESAFEILKECSKGQPCDITGIKDYQFIDKNEGVQWPLPAGTKLEDHQRRLFTDWKFYHKDGKAKFLFDEPREPAERPTEDYPIILLTGRGTSAQFHTQTRTSKSAILRKMYPQDIYVEINTSDAERMNVTGNEWIHVESRRGKLKARACITYHVQEGQIFIPMHYSDVNKLTYPEFDKYSRQPSFKYCAVKMRKLHSHE